MRLRRVWDASASDRFVAFTWTAEFRAFRRGAVLSGLSAGYWGLERRFEFKRLGMMVSRKRLRFYGSGFQGLGFRV